MKNNTVEMMGNSKVAQEIVNNITQNISVKLCCGTSYAVVYECELGIKETCEKDCSKCNERKKEYNLEFGESNFPFSTGIEYVNGNTLSDIMGSYAEISGIGYTFKYTDEKNNNICYKIESSSLWSESVNGLYLNGESFAYGLFAKEIDIVINEEVVSKCYTPNIYVNYSEAVNKYAKQIIGDGELPEYFCCIVNIICINLPLEKPMGYVKFNIEDYNYDVRYINDNEFEVSLVVDLAKCELIKVN